MKKKVLVVDDMAIVRKLLTDLISEDPQLEVVGVAADGKIALSKLGQLKPDIVILDVEMPEMNGLETVQNIRKIDARIPIVMFSAVTMSGAQVTLDALNSGANDYVTKPEKMTSIDESKEYLRRSLITKIRTLTGLDQIVFAEVPKTIQPVPKAQAVLPPLSHKPIEIVGIGISTGGPNALMTLFSGMPSRFSCPIVIVQHMPATFTKLFADRLGTITGLQVKEAQDGDVLGPNTVWLAPGNYHMVLSREGFKTVIRLNQNPEENFCRPAVDPLFRSIADIYGGASLGVIMTGMGQDGLLGAEEIRRQGGQIILQDEATSAVWGMPGACYRAGISNDVFPLEQLAFEISRRVEASNSRKELN